MSTFLVLFRLLLIGTCFVLSSLVNSSLAQWVTNGVAVSTASGGQASPTIASDGSGGAIITWQDFRSGTSTDIYAQRINASGVVQWTANGVAISTASGGQVSPTIVSDGSGGAIITWGDQRSGTGTDIYAQRINASGVVQWTANGVAISTASSEQKFPLIVSDGSGGAIITWEDWRAGTNSDIYAQRIDASGVVQWTANGAPISTASGSQYYPTIVSDGSGGAIITWQDRRSGTDWDIYAQRINAGGVVHWTTNGAAISTAIGEQFFPYIVSDGSGGAIITWQDRRSDTDWDIYAQRINAGGMVQWTANGVAISTAIGEQWYPRIVSDGSEGAIITWVDYRNGTANPATIYAQRINASGVVQWMANGVAVSTESGGQDSPSIVSDGSGGAIITWEDSRSGTNIDIYAQRINASGVVQLTANGVAISTASGAQKFPLIVSDGSGGAIITWEDWRSGFVNSDIYAQKVATNLVVTKPISGERWIAGDQDTIRWTRGEANQFVDIQFSTDSGLTYTLIDFGVPADSGYYVWTVPDSLTTRAKIRLLNTANQEVLAVSDTFKVKRYALTRINAAGRYEEFAPASHGWSFANADGNFWPGPWWLQFQYSGGIDRHTGQPYDPMFPAHPVFALPNHFVDWPVYVDVFGKDTCYWPSSNTYRPEMVIDWAFGKALWNGSCFGIVQSGLLYFHYRDQFRQRHPSVPLTNTLATITTMTDSIRIIINRYFTMQKGRLKRGHDVANASTTPRQTLQRIRQMWANDDPSDDAGLKYRDTLGSGGHAVIPYRLQRSTTNPVQFRLFVCNSNNPQSTNDFILIDSLTNRWREFTGFGWNSWSVQMHLYPPAVGFFAPTIHRPFLSSGMHEIDEGANRVLISSPGRSDLRILNSAGDSIGVKNGNGYNTISNAHLLDLETGHPQPPLGYNVPDASYRIRVANPVDSNVAVSIRSDSVILSYARRGASPGQRDELSYDSGLVAGNPDATPKNVDFQILLTGENNNRIANFTSIVFVQSDSMSLGLDAGARPRLVNFGSGKDYNLRLQHSSSQGLREFISPMHIVGLSTHIIAPRWDSLTTTTVAVYVDLGNNGTIDDTLIVNNTLDVDDRGDLGVPREYNLAQNYPNPFNPNTRIEYALPHAGHVTLTVHNLLGQLVATLVTQEHPPGKFSTEWNGMNSGGMNVGSGVYIYMLKVGGASNGSQYVQTRKMILVR